MSLPLCQDPQTAASSPRPRSAQTPRRDPRTAPFVLALVAASEPEPGAGFASRDTGPCSAIMAFAARLVAKRSLSIV